MKITLSFLWCLFYKIKIGENIVSDLMYGSLNHVKISTILKLLEMSR